MRNRSRCAGYVHRSEDYHVSFRDRHYHVRERITMKRNEKLCGMVERDGGFVCEAVGLGASRRRPDGDGGFGGLIFGDGGWNMELSWNNALISGDRE